MKALQKTRPAFGLELRERPAPDSPAAGEVIVAVGATGVCGTDVHIYPLERAIEGLELARTRGATKVMIVQP